ncbi:hypothetical protein D3C84_836740 [compost metagenome]
MYLKTVYEALAELMFPKPPQILCRSLPAIRKINAATKPANNLVARGLAPVGLQSGPKCCNSRSIRQTESCGMATSSEKKLAT